MKEPEMEHIGRWIAEALQRRSDDKALDRIRQQVLDLADRFPLYEERRSKSGFALAR